MPVMRVDVVALPHVVRVRTKTAALAVKVATARAAISTFATSGSVIAAKPLRRCGVRSSTLWVMCARMPLARKARVMNAAPASPPIAMLCAPRMAAATAHKAIVRVVIVPKVTDHAAMVSHGVKARLAATAAATAVADRAAAKVVAADRVGRARP